MLYKASLEGRFLRQVPFRSQVEIGLFIKPMETLMGKRVADFTDANVPLVRYPVKQPVAESCKMARMAYEQFRDTPQQ